MTNMWNNLHVWIINVKFSSTCKLRLRARLSAKVVICLHICLKTKHIYYSSLRELSIGGFHLHTRVQDSNYTAK